MKSKLLQLLYSAVVLCAFSTVSADESALTAESAVQDLLENLHFDKFKPTSKTSEAEWRRRLDRALAATNPTIALHDKENPQREFQVVVKLYLKTKAQLVMLEKQGTDIPQTFYKSNTGKEKSNSDIEEEFKYYYTTTWSGHVYRMKENLLWWASALASNDYRKSPNGRQILKERIVTIGVSEPIAEDILSSMEAKYPSMFTSK